MHYPTLVLTISLFFSSLFLAQASTAVTVPFEEKNGLIIVPVRIEGQTYRFMLDSGASEVIVSPALAERYGWREIGKIKITDTNGASRILPRLLVSSLEIGGFRFRKNKAHVCDFSRSPGLHDLGIDGILGASLLRQLYWQVDFTKGTVSLSQSLPHLAQADTESIPFRTGSSGQPYIDLDVHGHTVTNVLVDLGYNGDMEMNANRLGILSELADVSVIKARSHSPSGMFGQRQPEDVLIATLTDVHIGEHQVAPTVKGRPRAKAKIGTGFLEDFIVIFDWEQRVMHLQRP